MAGRLRIGGNGDILPPPEAHLKVFEDLSQVVAELVGGRGSVERRVVAHGPEEWLALILILAILPQTLAGECALGVLPLVDLAVPAFVGPGGGTEAD